MPENDVSKVMGSSDISATESSISTEGKAPERRRQTVALTLGSGVPVVMPILVPLRSWLSAAIT